MPGVPRSSPRSSQTTYRPWTTWQPSLDDIPAFSTFPMSAEAPKISPPHSSSSRYPRDFAACDLYGHKTGTRLSYLHGPMTLRISEVGSGPGTSFKLDGRLTEGVVLDLNDLHFADRQGVSALRELRAQGAKLTSVSPYLCLLLDGK